MNARAGDTKPVTAFSLSRAYRLAPIVPCDDDTLTRLRTERERTSLELAFDGHRVLACAAGGKVRVSSDDFRDWTEAFPQVARAIGKLAAKSVVVEGWLCALDDRSRPSFERLRAHVENKTRANILFAIADLLHLDGEDLRDRSVEHRRARLAQLLAGAASPLAISGSVPGAVDDVIEAARALGAGVLAREGTRAFSLATSVATRKLSPPPVVTNAQKVMYPRDGFTKADVVAYYADVATVMLPYLRDRPVVCQRWPDGIDEFTWYQHRLPPKAPDYLRGVFIEGNRRIVIDERDGLLWMVNQAALTFHGFASRVASLQEPDWIVLDLDPGERTTWQETIAVANAVRTLLEMLELPSVPKTSGQKGLHVLVPIARGHRVEQAHELARRLAEAIARVLPDVVSLDGAKERRRGRLFLDHLQNFIGKTLVLPYSLRAVDGAPASTPLSWSEVTPSLDPRVFGLRTMRRRLDGVGDLAAPLLSGTTRVDRVLAKLTPT